MMKRQCTSRARFSYSDDRSMLQFLISELKQGNDDAKNPFGNKIWQRAVNRRILADGNHTVTSIRDHFRRMLWPCLHFQAITPEERDFLKKNVRVSKDNRTDKSDSSSESEEDDKNAEESSTSDCYLFKLDRPKRQMAGVKIKNESLFGRSVDSKGRTVNAAKDKTSASPSRENHGDRSRRDHLRLNPEIIKLSPEGPQMNKQDNWKPKVTKAGARRKRAASDHRAEESTQSILDLTNDLAPTLIETTDATALSSIDVESQEVNAVLRDMVESGSLPLEAVPDFVAKITRLNEIARKYGASIQTVAAYAEKLKSLALVEEKLKTKSLAK